MLLMVINIGGLSLILQSGIAAEAIPLRRITAKLILRVLTKFVTQFGLPRMVQSYCGTQFTSGLFQQVMQTLGVQYITSSSYHS